jgi:hypothetical protein
MSKIFGHRFEVIRIAVDLIFRKSRHVIPRAAGVNTSDPILRIHPRSATLNNYCRAARLLGRPQWRSEIRSVFRDVASILCRFSHTAIDPQPVAD